MQAVQLSKAILRFHEDGLDLLIKILIQSQIISPG